jgi:DDE superfamily endonuclease
MEDLLELYAEPYDALYPGVCFDESPYQLVSETRQPLPLAPRRPARYDYEYRREGTCNLFMFFQPLAGWRHVEVTERRTAQDFAHCMKALVDEYFPQAELISVVLDNLNTHTPAALYETFPPAEARRIVRKLDFRYTPKHASWLNMAELEFAVVDGQCLDRRLSTPALVRREVVAWEAARNTAKTTVQWQFTVAKARKKLRHLYPA